MEAVSGCFGGHPRSFFLYLGTRQEGGRNFFNLSDVTCHLKEGGIRGSDELRAMCSSHDSCVTSKREGSEGVMS